MSAWAATPIATAPAAPPAPRPAQPAPRRRPRSRQPPLRRARARAQRRASVSRATGAAAAGRRQSRASHPTSEGGSCRCRLSRGGRGEKVCGGGFQAWPPEKSKLLPETRTEAVHLSQRRRSHVDVNVAVQDGRPNAAAAAGQWVGTSGRALRSASQRARTRARGCEPKACSSLAASPHDALGSHTRRTLFLAGETWLPTSFFAPAKRPRWARLNH